MTIPLQRGVIYGPVRSRRLGRSLGINVLPEGQRLCSFDCLYCQYGGSPRVVPRRQGQGFPPVDGILAAVEAALSQLADPPDYITFSGNGEATLHPGFAQLVDGVTGLRDRLALRAKTAILSNSSQVDDPGIRQALSRLDARVMKLDAGTEAMFAAYNRPAGGVTLARIAEGLRQLDGVVLQALFTGGPQGNSAPDHVEQWAALAATVRPAAVQLYSLSRPWPCAGLEPLTREELEEIQRIAAGHGLPAEVF